MHLLFVYGSLKEGFPNFRHNAGRRVAGTFVTVQPHPFMLADGQLPCLLPSPGEGLPVRGQLFEVDDAALARMDLLERVGDPGGYTRRPIRVVRDDAAGGELTAFAYMQDPAVLQQRPGPHLGPIAEYTMEHAARLSW